MNGLIIVALDGSIRNAMDEYPGRTSLSQPTGIRTANTTVLCHYTGLYQDTSLKYIEGIIF